MQCCYLRVKSSDRTLVWECSVPADLVSSVGRKALAGTGFRSLEPCSQPRASQFSGVRQSKSSLSNIWKVIWMNPNTIKRSTDSSVRKEEGYQTCKFILMHYNLSGDTENSLTSRGRYLTTGELGVWEVDRQELSGWSSLLVVLGISWLESMPRSVRSWAMSNFRYSRFSLNK